MLERVNEEQIAHQAVWIDTLNGLFPTFLLMADNQRKTFAGFIAILKEHTRFKQLSVEQATTLCQELLLLGFAAEQKNAALTKRQALSLETTALRYQFAWLAPSNRQMALTGALLAITGISFALILGSVNLPLWIILSTPLVTASIAFFGGAVLAHLQLKASLKAVLNVTHSSLSKGLFSYTHFCQEALNCVRSESSLVSELHVPVLALKNAVLHSFHQSHIKISTVFAIESGLSDLIARINNRDFTGAAQSLRSVNQRLASAYQMSPTLTLASWQFAKVAGLVVLLLGVVSSCSVIGSMGAVTAAALLMGKIVAAGLVMDTVGYTYNRYGLFKATAQFKQSVTEQLNSLQPAQGNAAPGLPSPGDPSLMLSA